MTKFWIITAIIFIVLTIIIAKFSYNSVRKESSAKMWKIGNGRTVYWEGVVVASSGMTILTMAILHFTNVLTF
jgi:uncharacterized membrane protein YidH (DUF202 family)